MARTDARIAALEAALADAQRARDAALEQQAATADVLRIISGAATDLLPVLDAVAGAAMRLCDASDANVWLAEGAGLVLAVSCGGHAGVIPVGSRTAPEDDTISAAAMRERRTLHIRDVATDAGAYPETQATMRGRGLGAARRAPSPISSSRWLRPSPIRR